MRLRSHQQQGALATGWRACRFGMLWCHGCRVFGHGGCTRCFVVIVREQGAERESTEVSMSNKECSLSNYLDTDHSLLRLGHSGRFPPQIAAIAMRGSTG